MMVHVMDDVAEHMMLVVMMIHGVVMPMMMIGLCLGHGRQESEAGHQKGGGNELLQHMCSFTSFAYYDVRIAVSQT
jgi:hypothetical protein